MEIDPNLFDKLPKTFDAKCVRRRANYSKPLPETNLVDNKKQPNYTEFKTTMQMRSPKLVKLLDKITELDAHDKREHGHLFKHIIFTDLKSSQYGAKMIMGGLMTLDIKLGYSAKRAKTKSGFGPLSFSTNDTLESNAYKNAYMLLSGAVFGKPLSTEHKRTILARFNERPSEVSSIARRTRSQTTKPDEANVHGKRIRFLILDSGFKEGIDVFDVRYCHIFEPQTTLADQKQAIGRGTRTCGQKGLKFTPSEGGWPLHVYIYDTTIPNELRNLFMGSATVFDLYLKALGIDAKQLVFASEMENMVIEGAVDYDLNRNVHEFGRATHSETQASRSSASEKSGGNSRELVSGKPPEMALNHTEMRKYIRENFSEYKWDKVELKNGCLQEGGASTLKYTPTQDFLRHYFTPSNFAKGMLVFHSTGSGKTCSAISIATSTFEPAGYTILWVTRTTLKNDIWKNMFGMSCHEGIRKMVDNRERIPAQLDNQLKLLGKSWRIRPMSYKQFSNLVSRKNALYQRLVKINGAADPLRKTLLIIDEAHKLYGTSDLSTIERPDMNAFYDAVQNSYAVSGADSVRLLLMTATPITQNGMEMAQLLNLCRANPLPNTFEDFYVQFLDENGKFTHEGKRIFLDKIAGYVSYLNREKDARQFAQPVLHHVHVPLVDPKQVIEFDKRAMKELEQSELTKKLVEAERVLLKDLQDKSRERFREMADICAKLENEPKLHKKCIAMSKKHIRELVESVKIEIEKVKDRISEIKSANKTAKEATKQVGKLSKTDPFKTSNYYILNHKCAERITNPKLVEVINALPEVAEALAGVRAIEGRIAQIERQAILLKKTCKNRVKLHRQLLKKTGIKGKDATQKLKYVEKECKKQTKFTHEALKEQIEEEKIGLKETQKIYRKIYNKGKKTLKIRISDAKKEARKEEKEAAKLRKEARKAGAFVESYTPVLGALVTAQKAKMDEEWTQQHAEIMAKIAAKSGKAEAKLQQQHLKEVAKQAKLDAKEAEAQFKAQVKQQKLEEAARLKAEKIQAKAFEAMLRKDEKNRAVLELKRMREEEALTRKLHKAAAKTAKKTQKQTKVTDFAAEVRFN